jgi:hypothetical protein
MFSTYRSGNKNCRSGQPVQPHSTALQHKLNGKQSSRDRSVESSRHTCVQCEQAVVGVPVPKSERVCLQRVRLSQPSHLCALYEQAACDTSVIKGVTLRFVLAHM